MKGTEMSLTQQSDEAAESKPQVKVAGTPVRHAAAVLLALALAFLAGKWSASTPAPPAVEPQPPAAHDGNVPSPSPTEWAALPPPSSTLNKLAFGSCADQKYPAPFWDTIAQLGPDLFIYGGDNVYGDCTGDCAGSGRCDCSTLSAAYDGLSSHPSFLGTKGRLPMVAIWDDHDYGWNDAGAEFVKRDEAKQLFLDFYSVPLSDPRRSREGLYTSYSYGPPERRVQVILLDQRYFRGSFMQSSPADQAAYTPGRERYLPDENSTETILGEDQWAWLEEQFLEPATVRVVVASFQLAVVGHGFERWGLIPRELQRFYDLIETTHANGVIVLSGDRHIGAIYRCVSHTTSLSNRVDQIFPEVSRCHLVL